MVIAQSPRRTSSNTGAGSNPHLAPRRKIDSHPERRLARPRRGSSGSSSGGAPLSQRMGPTPLAASFDDLLIKSPNDQRSYRVLHLSNGLFALLVHDPEIYSQPQGARDGDDAMEEASSGDDDEEEEDEDDDDDEMEDDEELDSEEEEEETRGGESEATRKKNKDETVKKVWFVLPPFSFLLEIL